MLYDEIGNSDGKYLASLYVRCTMGISSAGWGFPFFMVAAAAFMFQPGERLNRGIY